MRGAQQIRTHVGPKKTYTPLCLHTIFGSDYYCVFLRNSVPLLLPYLVRHPAPAPPRVDLGRSAASALQPGPRACTPPATRKSRSVLSRAPHSCVGASPRAFLGCGRTTARQTPNPQNHVNKFSYKKYTNTSTTNQTTHVYEGTYFMNYSRQYSSYVRVVRRVRSP